MVGARLGGGGGFRGRSPDGDHRRCLGDGLLPAAAVCVEGTAADGVEGTAALDGGVLVREAMASCGGRQYRREARRRHRMAAYTCGR
nr:unnamed protein product [Digitaria exilis]